MCNNIFIIDKIKDFGNIVKLMLFNSLLSLEWNPIYFLLLK